MESSYEIETLEKAGIRGQLNFQPSSYEIETLENAGIGGEGNFSLSSYINLQNKKQPCFALTKLRKTIINEKQLLTDDI